MKKFLIFVLIFMMSIQICSAKNNDYTINFNGTKYHLLYSVKNKDFGGYLNEYYRQGETYNIWSDMVAVHHFPNAYSPIDRIRDFKDYLASLNIPSALTFDDRKNAAMIDFIIINSDKMPIVLEFNIFKYEKSKKCGSVAVQYVKRYAATTTMQVEQIKTDFEKNRKKLIKAVKEFNIPQVITEDIDKCISGAELSKPDTTAVGSTDVDSAEKSTETENKPAEDHTTAATEDKCVTDNSSVQENVAKEEKTNEEAPTVDTANVNSDTTADNTEAVIQEVVTEVQKPEEEMTKKEENATDDIVKEGKITQPENTPVPQAVKGNEAKAEIGTKTEIKHKKQIKEADYLIINSKDDFYAKPRTKKELKELKKQNKKELKAKNTTYVITNNNNDLIAVPRSKKEMKEYKKALKTKHRKK